jgi:hypothetical protein
MKVVELLINGNPPCTVAIRLGITKDLVHYHQDKAEEYGVIKRKSSGHPLFFAPGPFYTYRTAIIGKGGSGRRISTSFCRLHPPGGNAFSLPVIKEGEQHELRTAEGDRLPLFPKRGGREASLQVPAHVLGYSGGMIKLNARGGPLLISAVPELRVLNPSILGVLLERENGPYGPLLDWLANLFTLNGWRLGSPSLPDHYHLAFDLGPVRSSCPELLRGVPFLERGQEEADLILWCDSSHGTPEIETTDPGLALDLFTLLHVLQVRDRSPELYPSITPSEPPKNSGGTPK